MSDGLPLPPNHSRLRETIAVLRDPGEAGEGFQALVADQMEQLLAENDRLIETLAKFVDFEDRYDADKSVSDDEVREATAFAKTLLDPAGPRLDWGGMHALVGQVARMNHESEQENGMSPDDAVDTLNSLITWARALVGAKEP